MIWLLLLVPVVSAVPLAYVIGAARAGYRVAGREPAVGLPAAPTSGPPPGATVTAARSSLSRGLASEQTALRRVATVVASGAPPPAVFSIVAAEVASLLELETGLVVRYTDGAGEVVCWWGAHRAPTGAAFDRWDGGTVARVAEGRRPSRIDGLTATVAERTVLGPFSTCIAAPVQVGGDAWGALLAVTRTDRRVPPGAEDRLARFAELVSLAVAGAETRAALEELGQEALRDHLTGLPNRRGFERSLVAAADRGGGRRRAVGLVLMDLDLQPLDDHRLEVTDAVLREVGRRLTALARRGDTLARLDGGRFAWLIDGGERSARDAAERARAAVEAAPVTGTRRLTLWTGVAEIGPEGDVAATVACADRACASARSAGVGRQPGEDHDGRADGEQAADEEQAA